MVISMKFSGLGYKKMHPGEAGTRLHEDGIFNTFTIILMRKSICFEYVLPKKNSRGDNNHSLHGQIKWWMAAFMEFKGKYFDGNSQAQ